mgnify:FL=1
MEGQETAAITTANIFTEAGNVMTGFIDMTGKFFTSLWANPMGKITIGLTLVGGAIGLAYKLFLRKKGV